MRSLSFFFFNDTATTEIYTLSLHDALPISETTLRGVRSGGNLVFRAAGENATVRERGSLTSCSKKDRKSTRLNSSHSQISYAVFCLKKKKNAPPPPCIPTEWKTSAHSYSSS